MPSWNDQDPETLRAILESWLGARMPGARELRLAPLEAPGATGFSSETVLLEATWTEHGEPRSGRWVLRSRPTGHTVFPEYDLEAQVACLRAVAASSDVPVPFVRWWEPDESVTGSPFYVMDRVEGEAPSDNPPYTVAGFLAEASPQQQRALYDAEIGLLVKLHAIDWKAAGLSFLDRPRFGPAGLRQQLGYWRSFLDWAAEGRPQPTIEAAFERLESRPPAASTDLVLNWGDARPSNILVRDFVPTAVLDWEMATLGPPEVDVAWFTTMNRFLSEGVGAPPLPGFRDTASTAELYATLGGRRLLDLEAWEVFAALRFALCFLRVVQRMERQGVAVAGWTETDNMATRFLARVGGFPEPA